MLYLPLIIAGLGATLTEARTHTKRWEDQCKGFVLPSSIPEGVIAKITNATYYPAGALFNETDPNTSLTSTKFKAFCRLQLNITTYPGSGAKSEVWLPDTWNGRFYGSANGASGGGLNWGDMGYTAVNYGFAAHATNGGHSAPGSSAAFARNNSEALIDWHYRALHQGTVAAKAVIASYYNQPKFYSYFAGCSAGGRQAWMEAERYPNDYDSILAGSPGLDDVRQSASALWVNQKVLPVNGSTWFSNATWNMVYKEVMKQCDAIDGVVDGVLNDPTKCKFRPAALACKPNQDNTTCLTPAQLGVLPYVYQPWVDTNDTYVYAGFPYGAEQGFVSGNLLPDGGQTGQDGDFFRYIVYNDSTWTVDKISFASVQLGVATIGDNGDSATNPNITAFVAKGGKLIQYVGWNDQYISPLESIHWHDKVDEYMSGHTNYTTEDYYRLFVVPGMKHCSGGAGPNAFGQPGSYASTPPPSTDPKYNAVWALVDWFEKGNAPKQFIGTSYNNNNATLGVGYQRPICQWPTTSVYNGSGDITKPESFSCKA